GRNRYSPLEVNGAGVDRPAADREFRTEQVAYVGAVVVTRCCIKQDGGLTFDRERKARHVSRVPVIQPLMPPSSPVDVTMFIQNNKRGAVFQRMRVSARTLMRAFMAAWIHRRMLLRRECFFCRPSPVHARADA